jgi:hypothetical protein
MATFVYRCPATGFHVQGFSIEHGIPASAPDDDTYEAVTCTACRRIHLVNPASGHVAGSAVQPLVKSRLA